MYKQHLRMVRCYNSTSRKSPDFSLFHPSRPLQEVQEQPVKLLKSHFSFRTADLKACGEGTVAADVCTERHGWVMRRVIGPCTSYIGASSSPPDWKRLVQWHSAGELSGAAVGSKTAELLVFSFHCRWRATVWPLTKASCHSWSTPTPICEDLY